MSTGWESMFPTAAVEIGHRGFASWAACQADCMADPLAEFPPELSQSATQSLRI